MKKTVLAVLMAVVMLATPCLAQERDSIEGTIWEVLPIGLQILPLPGIWTPDDLEFGFYGGKVYMQDISPTENTSYKDMLGFIVFSTTTPSTPTQVTEGGTEPFFLGILQPTGRGIVFVGDSSMYPPGLFINVGLLSKTEARFAPGRDAAEMPPEGPIEADFVPEEPE